MNCALADEVCAYKDALCLLLTREWLLGMPKHADPVDRLDRVPDRT